MSILSGHTTRAVGTVLTAEIYNSDHLNHVTNAATLNTDKVEGTPPPVVDGHAVVWDGVAGNALRTAGYTPFSTAGGTFTGTVTVPGVILRKPNAPVDSKVWSLDLADDTLSFTSVNDANSTNEIWLRVTRVGYNVTTIDFTSAGPGQLLRAGEVIWDDGNFDTRVNAVSGGGTVNFLRADGAFAAPPLPPAGSITLSTEQATTSGTSKDFTGIPAGVKRITVMIKKVSYTANSGQTLIQLGDAGGIETTGYDGGFNGFWVGINSEAADSISMTVILNLFNASTNTWLSGGEKALSGVLDRVRITSVAGHTFDAGAVNISYES